MPKRTCDIDGCENPHLARGLCNRHYLHAKYHGLLPPLPRLSPAERFWARVEKSPTCWIWTGARTPLGHGRIRLEGYGESLAHRWAYIQLVGPIPEGLVLDHLCANPPCVNPAHMDPVTHWQNTRRGTAPSAVNARKTHCIRGHEFNLENTRVRNDGSRDCKVCQRERDIRRLA